MSQSQSEQEFEALLDYLKRRRAFDFTGYKRPSLARRIEKRMGIAKVNSFADYTDYLEVHPEEFAALFNTILINVTSFYRDEESWDVLAGEVLPDLIGRKGNGQIRAWSAGCATGEEAYTLVMLFTDRLGQDGFKERVKIYATDIDDAALARARAATYTEREIANVPPKQLKKYFERTNEKYAFRKELRRHVVFGRHDLVTDAPISHVDLLVCRNTLMYLNSETQGKILSRFHFAMNDGGILFLGRAETLLAHASTFEPLDLKRRISRKVPRSNLNLRDRLILMAQNGADDVSSGITQQFRLRDVAMDATPLAQLVIDASGTLALANEAARSMFAFASSDVGRPLQDLKVSYRPFELRAVVDQARSDRRAVIVRDVESLQAPGDVHWLDLEVVPLFDAGSYLGASVTFSDVSTAKKLQSDLEHTTQELGAAYEELQSTNEELATTNEELHSTVEELETTNEELQSTNEELETMNEELQSTNEELHAINDETRLRGEELNRVNGFLESVLMSVRGAVVVLDNQQHVLVWNKRAEDLWGLRSDEVLAKHFLGLDIGLPVAALKQPLRDTLTNGHDGAEIEVAATNRRGKPTRVHVALTRLRNSDGGTRGVILVMNDAVQPVPLRRVVDE